MKDLLDRIFRMLQALPTTKQMIIIISGVVVLGFIGVKYFIPSKKIVVAAVHDGQCDYLMEQNRQLVAALLEIRSNLKAIPTSNVQRPSQIVFASFIDTTPSQKAITNIVRKIDSILVSNKLDSIRKAESLKKVKRKT